MRRGLYAAAAVAAVLSTSLAAQSRSRSFDRSADDWCGENRNDRYHHCEVRESTMPGLNPLDIDAGRNGGVRVRGWDRSDVRVRARIIGYADTQARARALVSGVRIETSGSSVRAEGPDTRSSSWDRDRDESWSVSFEIDVPRAAMMTLHANNGGISIQDFRGTAKFETRNGGVTLRDVAGDIRGTTTNGGVNIDLSGDRWDGAGLDVETRNGGVRLTVPDNYSASLETGTVNGRVSIDFPITLTGRISRRFSTTLGAGGARLRVMTTNGGVSIQRR